MKVVIVEDEVLIREGIIKLLKRFYSDVTEVYEAKSGDEGLEVIRRYKPDLVITDIRMEPLDGLEMLRILLEQEKRKFKTIILSAYSEFDYARKALSYGASDYLVKPVDVDEFRRAMRRIKKMLKQEESSDGLAVPFTAESALHSVVTGQIEPDKAAARNIESKFGLPVNDELALICARIIGDNEKNYVRIADIIQPILEQGGFKEYKTVYLQSDGELLFVIYNCDFIRLERYFQLEIMREFRYMENPPVFGFAVACGLEALRGTLASVRKYLPWSISLGSDVLISYPKVTHIQASELVYPIQLEKDSVEALCFANYEKLRADIDSFFDYITGQKHDPEAVKKSVLRYLMAILLAVREVNFEAYEKADESRMVEAVTKSISINELKAEAFRMLELAASFERKPVGLLVRKAQRMVEEYYHQGITLEVIATALSITPEHISARFVKELGVNFSGYIKGFRLQKAKELLLGTDLKLYEVAEQVGYGDAKYFSRVFKE